MGRAKAFFEKFTTAESPGVSDAWLSLLRLLRRNEEESLLHRAEAIMLELTHVLLKIESLRNDMQETQKKLQEELDGNHTKLDALKQRRVGHELALAGAKKNQAQLLKMKRKSRRGT